MDNIYLIFGEESYLINKKIKDIVSKYITNDIDNNVIKYDLSEISIDEALDDASMPSILSPIKVIVCTDAFFLTSSIRKTDFNHNVEKLIKYIDNPNPNTILILTINSSLDERKKIVKELRKKVKVYEFKKVEYNNLFDFTQNMFFNNGYKISKETIKILVNKVGYDLIRMNNEINKLMLYKYEEKIIEDSDIFNLVPKTIEENIFDLIDAAFNKDKEEVFTIYKELLNQGEEPIKIIVLLANQFRLIYQTKLYHEMGYIEKDIASKLGIHPYRIKLAHQKGRLFDKKTLLNYLNELADLDIAIKTGTIDKNIGLELFLLKI